MGSAAHTLAQVLVCSRAAHCVWNVALLAAASTVQRLAAAAACATE
jgi:hypothetical protein